MPKEEHPHIVVDQRERSGVKELLSSMGAIVEVRTLEIGDFLTSQRTCIERKTRNDFESSILDGRLFSQLSQMKQNYECAIVVVEGDAPTESRLSRAALLGAYSSVMADYGCSLFFTRSLEATAELVHAISRHEQLARKSPLRVYAKKKALTPSQAQRGIMESLPGVGPTLAKSLLKYFYTIENAITAPASELAQVEKMGEKKAKEIRRLLTTLYKEEDD
ncbi:hypothetical protein J4441_01340 [Candidatus Micrarchaeota archaeon]|nr:hypothetical protein [Candidatus Micrarchaeota archaeon]